MNPISWAVRALVANELGSGRWDVPVSEGSTESGESACKRWAATLWSSRPWAAARDPSRASCCPPPPLPMAPPSRCPAPLLSLPQLRAVRVASHFGPGNGPAARCSPPPAVRAPPSPLCRVRAVGQFCADQFDFYLGYQWVWGSVGVSWAWLAVFTVAGAFAMRFSKPASPKPTGEDGRRGCMRRGRMPPGRSACLLAC